MFQSYALGIRHAAAISVIRRNMECAGLQQRPVEVFGHKKAIGYAVAESDWKRSQAFPVTNTPLSSVAPAATETLAGGWAINRALVQQPPAPPKMFLYHTEAVYADGREV